MFASRAAILLGCFGILPAAIAFGEPPARNIPDTPVDTHGDPLPRGAVSRVGTVRFRHGACIEQVMYSPDGRTIAAGDEDGFLRIWDSTTGRQLWSAHIHLAVKCIAFTPDSKTLAAGGTVDGGSTLVQWNARTGQQGDCILRTKEPSKESRTANIVGLAYSPDGKLLAVGVLNSTVRILEVASSKELRALDGFWCDPACLSFSPDSKMLAGPSIDQAIRLCDVATGNEVIRIGIPGSSVEAVRFSPDGKRLAVAARDALYHFDVSQRKELVKFPSESRSPRAMAFMPNGEMIVTGSAGSGIGDVQLWAVATGKEVRRIGCHQGTITSLSVSPDGETVAVGAFNQGAIGLWKVATGKDALGDQDTNVAVRTASWAADNKTIVTVGDAGRVLVFDSLTGRPSRRLTETGTPTWVVAYSPDGKTVACGGRNVRLIDATTGQLLREWEVDRHAGSGLAFSPDGRTLASCNLSSTVTLSDAARGQVRLQITTPDSFIRSVRFSPCGRYLATESNDGHLGLWDPTTGKQCRPIAARAEHWLVAAFSPDSRVIATGGRGVPVVIWEMLTRGERVRLGGAEDAATALAFSPRSDVLAVGRVGGAIGLFDLATGREWHTFSGHRGEVTSLVFSCDGRQLLSASADTTALVWDLTTLANPRPPPIEPLRDEDIQRFWDDLASEDAEKAARAIWQLTLAAGQSLPRLRERIRPAEPAGERLAQLVSDLDNPSFTMREKAERELQRYGDTAESGLRAALQSQPSAELKRRALRLLERLEQANPAPEQLRVVRLVEVLERTPSPIARDILKALAAGAPEARITREARSALERTNGSK